eukprot:6209611-Pleurochrysis_carterae.AAC.1
MIQSFDDSFRIKHFNVDFVRCTFTATSRLSASQQQQWVPSYMFVIRKPSALFQRERDRLGPVWCGVHRGAQQASCQPAVNLQRGTMRIRASARHEEPVAIGRSNSEDRSPNIGGQVLMHPWSMYFSNVNMEHAYAKACERSVSPVLVLTVLNMLQFCLLCIGVGLDCKMVREYVFALYSVSLPIHAAEVCSFIWPSSTEESSGRSLIDRFRVLSIGFAFVVYNLMSYIAQEYPQTTSDFGMSAKSFISGMFDDCCSEGSFACNILGLGINAPIAVFINVFPYLSYYKPAAKFFLPCCCIGIHVFAPCWQLPSGIEPLIIGINTLAGVGLGTIIEHLRRSTFRDLHQSRVNQRQAVQAKVVGGLHFAHNIKGEEPLCVCLAAFYLEVRYLLLGAKRMVLKL